MTSLGRNDPCPCGSGKKFKKCHVTWEPLPYVKPWKLRAIEVFTRQPDFMPPMSQVEHNTWKYSGDRDDYLGCPFDGDEVCTRSTDYGGSCAALDCGV